ncbi:MAG: glycosyltransferase family 2 protein [Niabella sp.]
MTKFSVILPVRNGGNHIGECINSILGQAYFNFELLILENNSSDDTLRIIHSFQDERIKVFSSKTDLTIEQNWGRILQLNKAEFITLIGHDDVLDKRYLQEINSLIAEYPGAGLYQTHFKYINANGQEVRKCKPMFRYYTPEKAIAYFLEDKIDLMGTGFMMRAKVYDEAGGIPPYPNLLFADMQLMIDMAKNGGMAVSLRELFSYRIHPAATTSVSSDAKFLNAFGRLVDYLADLENKEPRLAGAIQNSSPVLLNKYCQGITHKILKTNKKDRQTPSVREAIDIFSGYSQRLCNNKYAPLSNKAVRLGKTIDANPLLHWIFIIFKKIYKKPVL